MSSRRTPASTVWVTDTFEWRREARLAQPANPMPDSEAPAFVFVASRLSNQVALPGKRYGVSDGLIGGPLLTVGRYASS